MRRRQDSSDGGFFVFIVSLLENLKKKATKAKTRSYDATGIF